MRRVVGRVGIVIIAALLVLVGGCTDVGGVGPLVDDPTSTSPAATRTASPTALDSSPASRGLQHQKAAAGIADCPASDAGVPPRPGGLPDVVLPCLGGGRSVRLAGLRGRPLVINVWAQWCGPCRAEAPVLAQVAAAAGDRLLIMGVDYADRADPALGYARAAGWRYPQIADPDQRLKSPLSILGPPLTIFVRADGTVAARHAGPFTSVAQLRSAISQHLGVAW